MDDTSEPQAGPIDEQASDLSDKTLTNKKLAELYSDRELHVRWYNALPADDQAEVRDKIRGEIMRIRSELGKRTEPLYPLPVRRREQG
jgi:hypothetical protein